tara:strand:+ start:1264 stop:1650 length:387 start_codon:yes stop_codon:yes gene_type:complete
MNSNDLIYYKQSGGGIQSLGFNFKNILLSKNIPVTYSGGNKNLKKFYNNMDSYSIPTSLVLLNKRVEDLKNNPTVFDLYDSISLSKNKERYDYDDDLHTQLMKLSGFRKSKTRKNRKKAYKNTRKKRN